MMDTDMVIELRQFKRKDGRSVLQCRFAVQTYVDHNTGYDCNPLQWDQESEWQDVPNVIEGSDDDR